MSDAVLKRGNDLPHDDKKDPTEFNPGNLVANFTIKRLPLTSVILLVVLQAYAQRIPGELFKAFGVYPVYEKEFVSLGIIEDYPVIIFSDGSVRGLRKARSGVYEIGNALARFDTLEGSIVLKKESISLTRMGQQLTPRKLALGRKEITFGNGSVKLQGELIIPEGRGPFPCIILTHGSGPEKREANLGIAGLFAGNGIAAFVYDKRFVVEQKDRWQDDSFTNYANDAIEAAHTVARETTIDPMRIGIYGHSQGGWVAPLAASQDNIFSFIIISAGNAVNPVEQHLWSGTRANKLNGVGEESIQSIYEFRKIKYHAAIIGDSSQYKPALAIAKTKRWFERTGGDLPQGNFWKVNGYYDPKPALKLLTIAVLVMGGELDNYSNTENNMKIFHRIFEESGNISKVTFKVFKSANHGYFETTTGKFDHQEFPELKRFAPEYFETLIRWTSSVTRR